MAARTFHFADGNSDKFWSIELAGASHTVRFGRTGTAGQRQVKAFANEAEAQRSYDRLIREKLAKGYVEVATPELGVLPPGWREALRLFDVGDAEIDEALGNPENLDPERVFASLVADSPRGVRTTRGGAAVESLRRLAEAMNPMPTGFEVDEQDGSRLGLAVITQGRTRLYVLEGPHGPEDFPGLVHAVAQVLPPDVVGIYALPLITGREGWGHAALKRANWDEVRRLLGAAFDRVFAPLPPSAARFVPCPDESQRLWQQHVSHELKSWQLGLSNLRADFEKEQNAVLRLLTRASDPKLWKGYFETFLPKKYIREFLDSLQSTQRLAHAIAPLDTIAHYRCARGGVQVLEGDPNGWAEYHAGLRTYLWSILLSAWATREPSIEQHADPGDLDRFLAGCLALGEWEMARRVFHRVLAGTWDFDEHSSTPLLPLALRLCALEQDVPFKRIPATEPLRQYKAVFSAWKNPDALAKVLTEVCDYHVEFTLHPVSDEFQTFPRSIAPLEVLAVLRVRRKLGLPVPAIEHPILDTPLGRPPEPTPTMPDDLLDLLVQTVEAELPPL